MTITFSLGDAPPVDLPAITEGWLKEAAEGLAITVEAIKAGNFDQIKAAQSAVRDLKQAFHSASEERSRVEKLRKQVAGEVGGGVGEAVLDLAAARDEIWRRLARLRDAGED
jgi:hypothetical protein